MIKRILLGLSLVCLTACSSTAPFAVTSDDAWFLEKDGFGQLRPIFCMANKKDPKGFPECRESVRTTYEVTK